MNLKLEVGKRYVTEDGWVTPPLEPNSDSRLPFAALHGDSRPSWTSDGFYHLGKTEYPLNLVAEFSEPEPWTPYNNEKPFGRLTGARQAEMKGASHTHMFWVIDDQWEIAERPTWHISDIYRAVHGEVSMENAPMSDLDKYIQSAVAKLGVVSDKIDRLAGRFKEDAGFLRKKGEAMDNALEAIAALRAENEKLATNTCIHPDGDGLICDEYGNAVCAKAERIATLQLENTRMKIADGGRRAPD